MTRLFDITVTGPEGLVHTDRISAETLTEAKATVMGWWSERRVYGERYLRHGYVYEIWRVNRNSNGAERGSCLWRDVAQVYNTELTPEGEQLLIPGTETNASPVGPQQLNLFG